MKRTFLKTMTSVAYYAIFVMMLLPTITSAQEPNEYVGAKLTEARIVSLLLLAMSIASVITALRAKKRFNANNRRGGLVIAFVLGLIAVIISAVRISAATNFGTGGGKAGAIVALLMGVTGIGLAIRPFLQARKNSNPN